MLNIISGGLYYEVPGLRELCHAVKAMDKESYVDAAELLADLVDENALSGYTIIPIPNHSGKAEYTLEILKQLKNIININIKDCLTSAEHAPMYSIKKDKSILHKDDLGFVKHGTINPNRTILFDNVIGTGTTYFYAMEAVGYNIPLLSLAQSRPDEWYENKYKDFLNNENQKLESLHRRVKVLENILLCKQYK